MTEPQQFQNRHDADIPHQNFTGMVFDSSFMKELWFTNTTIENHNFTAAYIPDFDLFEQEIVYCNFSDTVINNMSYASAMLSHCKFNRASIGKLTFFQSNIEAVSFSNSSIIELSAGMIFLNDCDFSDATLFKVNFDEGQVGSNDFKRCHITAGEVHSIDFCFNDFRWGTFANIKFDSVRFSESQLSHAKFINCEIVSCQIDECIAIKADFRGSSLNSVDFCNTDLTGANFEGTTLSQCIINDHTKGFPAHAQDTIVQPIIPRKIPMSYSNDSDDDIPF